MEAKGAVKNNNINKLVELVYSKCTDHQQVLVVRYKSSLCEPVLKN